MSVGNFQNKNFSIWNLFGTMTLQSINLSPTRVCTDHGQLWWKWYVFLLWIKYSLSCEQYIMNLRIPILVHGAVTGFTIWHHGTENHTKCCCCCFLFVCFCLFCIFSHWNQLKRKPHWKLHWFVSYAILVEKKNQCFNSFHLFMGFSVLLRIFSVTVS